MPDKRSFYADDDVSIPTPGYNSKISDSLKQKESLHDATEVEGMIIRTVPVFERYANEARLYLHNKRELAAAEWGTQKSAFCNEVKSIKTHIDTTIVEPVLPSLIYILTTALSGSIMVNKSSLPVRFVAPLLFGTAAYKYFMPQSYANTVAHAAFYEAKFPAVVQGHADLDATINSAKATTKKTVDCANESLVLGVRATRLWVKDTIEEIKGDK
ncbi:hypothetical protein BABINDRAFT_29863 [Babjeviella inositovora NRRL Y-12698]|uniref:MICOS complex subunit n=1 Tax=Babjeviella inositovora NRRL Y-12698 TaxID=984486 RepID=A0A1E3QYJ5_9ASCO|nr:uncharacterized protein BABINDRAFT_29863 [Babjeviella inositovora NRRL Y-12698]ODQ82696.1 hypothetical protein BABINDRAFT_29863 [Babjeviella inositovora NRRL Y-12698]